MKKTLLAVVILFSSITASAQFYVSGAGGYSFGMSGDLGDNIAPQLTATGINFDSVETVEGSYGEGIHTQIRAGYFFNDKWGIELGLGYLHGSEQDSQKVQGITGVQDGNILDVSAKGRAFGASLSGIYNITENVYVRAGVLTKIGGKTKSVTTIALPAALLPELPDAQAEFETDFRGKLPIGVIGALGYKFPISDNWSLFAELEYMGIEVDRKKSEFVEYKSGQLVDAASGQVVAPLPKDTLYAILIGSGEPLNQVGYLLEDEHDWSDSGEVAPYSSLGINFGFTYKFN